MKIIDSSLFAVYFKHTVFRMDHATNDDVVERKGLKALQWQHEDDATSDMY